MQAGSSRTLPETLLTGFSHIDTFPYIVDEVYYEDEEEAEEYYKDDVTHLSAAQLLGHTEDRFSHIEAHLYITLPGDMAWSVAMSLGNQGATRSILMSGISFREDLVMKIFLRPFFLFR